MPTAATPKDRALAALNRKLERWELQHLRDHADELHEQLLDLQRELAETKRARDWAEDSAEHWRAEALQMAEQAAGEDGHVGITVHGELVALPADSHGSPAIGQPWPGQGGIYAGITRGVDGQPDQHLILCPAKPAARAWQPAMEWAASLIHDGHEDWSIPTRDESALLYANLRDQFDDGWHWTGTQYSQSDAWYQYFSDGIQGDDGKEYEGRARAVRRFSVQSFIPSSTAGAAEPVEAAS